MSDSFGERIPARRRSTILLVLCHHDKMRTHNYDENFVMKSLPTFRRNFFKGMPRMRERLSMKFRHNSAFSDIGLQFSCVWHLNRMNIQSAIRVTKISRKSWLCDRPGIQTVHDRFIFPAGCQTLRLLSFKNAESGAFCLNRTTIVLPSIRSHGLPMKLKPFISK
jgi:hypothetical protein